MSEYRLEIGVFEVGGPVSSKLSESDRRRRPPPTIFADRFCAMALENVKGNLHCRGVCL